MAAALAGEVLAGARLMREGGRAGGPGAGAGRREEERGADAEEGEQGGQLGDLAWGIHAASVGRRSPPAPENDGFWTESSTGGCSLLVTPAWTPRQHGTRLESLSSRGGSALGSGDLTEN